jgi:hypothetical protein
MTTAVSIVNIVLVAFVFAAVVGGLAWSITSGQGTGGERLRARTARTDVSPADDRVRGAHAADQTLVVG